MKKILKTMVAALATMSVLVACTPTEQTATSSDAPAADEKLVVGITEYEPMNYKDENGEWTGFDTEFAQAVAEKLGMEAEFIVIEWDNKIAELDSDAIDCVWNGMTLTDEVKNGMDCSQPYIVNAQVVVAKADKIADIKTAEDLKDLKLTAEAGSAGEKAIIAAGYECTGVSAQSDALLEVNSGAADACVIDITMANAMTGEGTSYADLAGGISLTSEEYGIGFKKGSELTAKVDAVIDEMQADGSLQTLAEKYELTLAE